MRFISYSRGDAVTVVQYNQTAADLENLQSWWTKLTPAQRRNPKNIDRLVEFAEKALETEMVGWGQRMEDALEKLHEPEARSVTPDDAPITAVETEKKGGGGE